MSARLWTYSTIPFALLLALAAGCGSPPKPPPPPPDDGMPDKWDGGDAGVKQKECKALSEKCVAEASTVAKIAKVDGFVLTPVSGWTFAQGENAFVATAADESSVMIVTGYDVPSPANAKQEAQNRDAAYEAAAKEVETTLPKKKPNWKSPDGEVKAGSLKFNLWEVPGATRKEKKSTLVVFATAAALPNGKHVIGFGVIADDDPKAGEVSEKIQAAVATFKEGDASKDTAKEPEKDSGAPASGKAK